MALPKPYRFHLQKDFDLMFKAGSSIRFDFALIKKIKKRNNYPRIAVVISKKIAKKAVLRNLIKRRLLAIFDKIGFRKSEYDILILIQKDISEINFDDILKNFESKRILS